MQPAAVPASGRFRLSVQRLAETYPRPPGGMAILTSEKE
tara:strand:+ start:104585 stop:104701 length:117 start_codon:yes stop_codon:yes gene_type:complete